MTLGLKSVAENIIADRESKSGPVNTGGSKVYAAEHAGVFHFFERGGEAVEVASNPRHCIGGHVKRSLLTEGL